MNKYTTLAAILLLPSCFISVYAQTQTQGNLYMNGIGTLTISKVTGPATVTCTSTGAYQELLNSFNSNRDLHC